MKFRFEQDNDGHWFLLPVELVARFNKLLDSEEYETFNEEFWDKYYIGCHPNCFTFENPKESY